MEENWGIERWEVMKEEEEFFAFYNFEVRL